MKKLLSKLVTIPSFLCEEAIGKELI